MATVCPELSEQVVMLIDVNDLPPAPPEFVSNITLPHYYWRSLTYNRYTGRGWITDKTETINYVAGEQVHKLGLPAHQLVKLRVQEVEEFGGLVHFAGTLISIDQDFQVAWRSLPPIDSDTTSEVATAIPVDDPDGKLLDNSSFDVFGAIAEANTYLVDSLVPTVSMAQLRSSGNDYPTWILDRYLALPNDIPSRVLGLARDLTATQPTQYDRALAIETHLRSYAYTLDISTPPPGKDVVDYFLFDLKRGYCDYYATSMVVLARAAGIPARLVVGYATGSYDDQNRRYVVTAADAHSWPEISFPGYGWIEFEPTAGRPPLERPNEIPLGEDVELDETLEPTPSTIFNLLDGPTLRLTLTMIAFVLTTLIIGFFVWSLTDTWRLSRVNPTITISTLYQRLFSERASTGSTNPNRRYPSRICGFFFRSHQRPRRR